MLDEKDEWLVKDKKNVDMSLDNLKSLKLEGSGGQIKEMSKLQLRQSLAGTNTARHLRN